MTGGQEGVSVGIRLSTPVERLRGVGPKRAMALARLGIRKVADLIRHYPLRYERHFPEGAIAELRPEVMGAARGVVVSARPVPRVAGAQPRFEAVIEDASGRLALVWFNALYLRDQIRPGMVIRVHGKAVWFRGQMQMINPRWEEVREGEAAEAKGLVQGGRERLVPVYPATENLPSRFIQQLVEQVLPEVLGELVDPLPAELRERRQMPELGRAFRMIHQPHNLDEVAEARRRLAYNELFLLQLGVIFKRYYNETVLAAPALRWSEAIDAHIRARFPFRLTAAQDRVIGEIVQDLRRTYPMNRLLQGDVGSGKTVVALYALLMAVANRKQGAMMAPTELLAEQHYWTIRRMLEGSNVRLGLLTGAMGSSARRELLADIRQGRVDIVVGTHALLTEAVEFADLAVVVIDEQHRFGVLQRARWKQVWKEQAGEEESGAGVSANGPVEAGRKRILSPHYLVMTATPIPRTLSLTVFGDLDVSVIDQLPPGRGPIETRLVGMHEAERVYEELGRRVAEGEQAYVVVPTIDAQGRESAGHLKDLRTLTKLMQERYCRGVAVAAVHGRLKAEVRQEIMERFRRGEIRVLVATTVIEVGVDVPNATVMVIVHAERFGLAQLHQLRGRVGRGGDGRKSTCILIADATTEESRARLAAIIGTCDGFRIAEADLEIRGIGDFFGTRQHGLPPLRVARIPGDMELLNLARRDADNLLREDPGLVRPEHQRLRRLLLRQYGGAIGLVDVG